MTRKKYSGIVLAIVFLLTLVFFIAACNQDELMISQSSNNEELIACGDILSRFAVKPQHVEYVGCEENPNSQKIITAEYRVTGANSQIVEDYFVNTHGMRPLKIFSHTGWEPNGGLSIEFESLKQVDPYAVLYIEMWGYARRNDNENGVIDFSLLPREEVPYFTVEVSIAII